MFLTAEGVAEPHAEGEPAARDRQDHVGPEPGVGHLLRQLAGGRAEEVVGEDLALAAHGTIPPEPGHRRKTGPPGTSERVGVRLVVLRLAQRLADHREREAGGVALAGQEAGQAAGGDLAVETAHGAQLLVDQRAGGGALVGLVDLLQRGLGVLVVDALAAQLLGQRPRSQSPAAVPALDPLPGVGGVVDQADLGEAVEQLAGELVGHAPLGQLVGQLLAGARLPGEGVEQDLAGDGLGIGLELGGRGLLPGEPGCLALLPGAGRLAATLAAPLPPRDDRRRRARRGRGPDEVRPAWMGSAPTP